MQLSTSIIPTTSGGAFIANGISLYLRSAWIPQVVGLTRNRVLPKCNKAGLMRIDQGFRNVRSDSC